MTETPAPVKPNDEVLKELQFVAPILALNLKIGDRIQLAEELQVGLKCYTPSPEVSNFLKKSKGQDIAMLMPNLALKRAFLDSFDGEIGEHVLNDLSGDSYHCDGEPPTLIQRQFLIARFMTEIKGS